MSDPHKKTVGTGALAGLALAALGVVYGDIGTSPLYAFRTCFAPDANGIVRFQHIPENIFGVLSLITLALVGLISIKYVLLLLRADNKGEGGDLALMALIRRCGGVSVRTQGVVFVLALLGASLVYGDGLITPAISVLSAVEGLKVATPAFEPYVVWITLLVLLGLFVIQRHGTASIGVFFGPVMTVWFAILALLGVVNIAAHPAILGALNPWHGIIFFWHHTGEAFVVLGSVFLVMTGGEALYVDMGHFGKRPIQASWIAIVLPALLLNYFGQGAWMLEALQRPEATEVLRGGAIAVKSDLVKTLFYRMAPGWALYPLVGLATLATVIASQAVISGAFSLARQAIQLGCLPRQRIVHTSEETIGQVFLPVVNVLLLIGTAVLVLGFRESDRLAGAYGFSVSLAMLITALLLAMAMRHCWRWPMPLVLLFMVPILVADLGFFVSNSLKLAHGGWVGLVVGAFVLLLMWTWTQGRNLVGKQFADDVFPLRDFVANVEETKPLRVPGTAVFLTANPEGIPRTLMHNFKHNKVLHERILILSITTEEIPRVPLNDRIHFREYDQGFYTVTIRYGFSEEPNIPRSLRLLKAQGLELDPMQLTYVLGRESLVLVNRRPMGLWRKQLFSFMSRNAYDASKFFHIPTNRVIEVGIQVEI